MRITTAAPRFLAQKFDCPRVSPGDAPLTKEPVDSGYEIVIAREKKFGRVRLSTNALKINMEDVASIVAFGNLSWSSSVNRLLLLFVLALVNLDLLWMESQTSRMESKRLVEESLTAVSTCSHLMENLLKGFYCQALVL